MKFRISSVIAISMMALLSIGLVACSSSDAAAAAAPA